MSIRHCPVCGTSPSPGNHISVNYFRCALCATVIKNLSPAEYMMLQPGYDAGEALSSRETRIALAVDDKVRFLRSHLAVGWSSFLDIGCGAGGYLAAAAELGLDPVGVEPSEAHSAIARRDGYYVHNDYFSAELFPEKRFDVVLMSHVIEHIYDPVSFLHSVSKVLQPNGVIILVTPNASSTAASLTGRRWPMFKPVDHVTLFSPQSIALACRSAGLDPKVSTSEYRGETIATVGASILGAVRREKMGGSTSGTKNYKDEKGWRSSGLLGVLDGPFYLFNRLTGRSGAIVCSARISSA